MAYVSQRALQILARACDLPHRANALLRWDTGASAWRVAVDRCPHRLAPLSEGRVDNFGHLVAWNNYSVTNAPPWLVE